MIEAPRIVESHRERGEQGLDALGENRISGRWILHLIQLAREPAKVVDGPGRGADGDAGPGHEPMSGDGQNRTWTRGVVADTSPAFGVRIVQERVHRVAVAEEYRRKNARHCRRPPFSNARLLQVARVGARWRFCARASSALSGRRGL
jgi:hypothetical protein